MKNRKLLIFAIVLFGCISCSDKVSVNGIYGDCLIYMPQATHNLGIDNNLYLSVNSSSVSENKNTRTTIGIYRSGTAPKESVTVELVVDTDSLSKAIMIAKEENAPAKYSIYKEAELLDSHYYSSLPSKLTIEDGQREAKTQLCLDNKKIIENYSKGSVLVLPLRITNPTKYKLNEGLSLTMVVIEVKE